MRVLKPGQTPDQPAQNWKFAVDCETCEARLLILTSDVFKKKVTLPMASGLSFNTMCPYCGDQIPVPYQALPNENQIQTKDQWLDTRQKSLIATLFLENRENWKTVRQGLIEDGVPEELLVEINL